MAASTPPLDPGTANDVLVTNPNGGHAVLRRAFLIDFLDVAESDPFHDAIAAVLRAASAAGCGGGNYCPTAPVTRAQMAVFLLKARLGSSHVPPAGTGGFRGRALERLRGRMDRGTLRPRYHGRMLHGPAAVLSGSHRARARRWPCSS